MDSGEIRAQLERLHIERLEAESAGLTACRPYMEDLEQEIEGCRVALVGAHVTEVAVARAKLYGALVG
jgi:hypothetical protein